MTLTELKYVVTVSMTHHFGKAAELCKISQPSLSVAIKKLETELGVMIFERRNTEIVPTAIGERIIAQARVVLHESQKIQEMAHIDKDPLDGPLRLGIIFTISPFLLPELVKRSIARTPQMPLIITEDYTVNLIQKLKNGQLDAAICALPVYEPSLMCCNLYDEDFKVLVPGNHPFVKRKTVTPADLSKEEMLILAQGNCMRDQVLEVCPDRRQAEIAESGNAVNMIEGSSLSTIRHMVASGLGISVFPASAENYDLNDTLVRYVNFAEPIPQRRVCILWRKTFPRELAIMTLVETCAQLRLEGIYHLAPDPKPLTRETN